MLVECGHGRPQTFWQWQSQGLAAALQACMMVQGLAGVLYEQGSCRIEHMLMQCCL